MTTRRRDEGASASWGVARVWGLAVVAAPAGVRVAWTRAVWEEMAMVAVVSVVSVVLVVVSVVSVVA